jgi:hypothetical protein
MTFCSETRTKWISPLKFFGALAAKFEAKTFLSSWSQIRLYFIPFPINYLSLRSHSTNQPNCYLKGERQKMLTSNSSKNRANAQHSTGPRSIIGKQHSSLNATTHGLTSQSPILPTENPDAFNLHTQSFFDEYHPKTPTEKQLVQDLADTSWRINRIPMLERDLLMLNATQPAGSINVDIPDLQTCNAVTESLRRQERTLASLSMHGHRLSRQFHKTLDQLREIQAVRRETAERDLKKAAAILEMHKHKGLSYNPAEDGFVFSNAEVEAHSQRLIRLNQARHIEHVLFHAPPQYVSSMSH